MLKNNFVLNQFVFPVEHLKTGPPQPKVTKQSKPKVFVANGSDVALKGTCLLFIKAGDPGTVINEQNIVKVRCSAYTSSRSTFMTKKANFFLIIF